MLYRINDRLSKKSATDPQQKYSQQQQLRHLLYAQQPPLQLRLLPTAEQSPLDLIATAKPQQYAPEGGTACRRVGLLVPKQG